MVFLLQKLSKNNEESLEKSRYGPLIANNLQSTSWTVNDIPLNNLQQATCNQILLIFLCHFMFAPFFRGIFADKTFFLKIYTNILEQINNWLQAFLGSGPNEGKNPAE